MGKWGFVIEIKNILIFDGHIVMLAHFEFYESLTWIVLQDVGWILKWILRASADKFVMFAIP